MVDRTPISELAAAKINLSLEIRGKRPDGYHELSSLVVFTKLGDHLTVTPTDDLSLRIEGPFATSLIDETDNLVLRAARALQAHCRVSHGAALVLEKNLPIASGIGGGSADAAATLRALTRLWQIEILPRDLNALALHLGADVPACLGSQSCRMSGIGEQVEAVDYMPRFSLLLVNPLVPVATREVFARLAAPPVRVAQPPIEVPDFASVTALLAWLHDHGNDLQQPARQTAPVIGEVLSALHEDATCLLARMSGSGATCFGIYADEVEASAAASLLRRRRPGWWVAATSLNQHQ